MRRICSAVIPLVLLFFPLSARAYGGYMFPANSPNPNPSDFCAIRDGAIVNVYIFHRYSDGTQGIRYKAIPSPCSPWVWVSDLNNFPSSGDSQAGIEFVYGACLDWTAGNILVQTITFAGGGLLGCCWFAPGAYPGDEQPMSKRCDGAYDTVEALAALSRPEDAIFSLCPCPLPDPTHESTWGVIKALFAAEN